MSYVLIYAETDYETSEVQVDYETIDDFVEMMMRFTLISSAGEAVTVIEPDTKKIVCHYIPKGKTLFNKLLLDGTIYVNDAE